MRTIKFRAWDIKFGVMIPDVAVYDNENICIPDVTVNNLYSGENLDARLDELGGDVPEWYLMTGGFELMQFTGLLDKNGKEIYEGDIIPSQMDGCDENCVVGFCDSCFCLANKERQRPINTAHSFLNWTPVGEVNGYAPFEIIGNIYENPELLK